MRSIIAMFLLFSTAQLFSQKSIDTVYLNKNFDKVRKSKAVFYRCLSKNLNSGLYRTMDYKLSGELVKMGTYKDKEAHIANGMVTKFYPNGLVKHETNYIDGKLKGVVKSYYNNGNPMREEKYDNDKLISGKYFTYDGRDTLLSPYFQYPSFEGGDIELQKFIRDNILYPNEAAGRGLEGTVLVGLLIMKDGLLVKIGILSSTNDIFNKEAIRVIKLTSHKWIPGFDEGKPADMAISVPMAFTSK